MPKLNFDVDKLWGLVWDSIESEGCIISSVEILSQERTENILKVNYKASFYMEPEYAGRSDRWSTSLEYEEKTCVFEIVTKDGIEELLFKEWLDSGREYSVSVDDPTTDKSVIEEWRSLISQIIDKDDAVEYLEDEGKEGSPALYSFM